ncbi:MAG TPA: PBP1A family penicillin-binding protein [Pyrinomonadaceae bacterium]|nr:PBP1A family penicillin-binding protein [Pyrinomonadaceae bacterium]
MAIEITSERAPRRLLRLKRASSQLRQDVTHARRRQLLVRLLFVLPIISLVAVAITLTCFYISYAGIVDERLASGYLTSRAGIYAAPRVLLVGQSFSRERLADVLRRAGYVEGAATSEVWSGRFMVEGESIRIFPRRMAGASHSLAEVRVDFDRRKHISDIRGDGESLPSYALEPEALTNDATMKTGTRAALAYDDLPPVLVRAVLAIEDKRFFEHRGLDASGIARAAWSWVAGAGSSGGEDVRRQGGSTITQQLVKNTYLTPERTLRRKFNEAMLASVIERRLSKEDILALYCNEIYLGQRGSAAVRGVGQAARVYFGKELKDLTLAEAATIAGMIQSPARYAPDRHPEAAAQRRDTVISAMLDEGFINRDEADAATREPLSVVPLAEANNATAPYFIDYVNRVVESGLENSAGVDEHNLRVYTTIDLELQQLAEKSVGRQLERLEKVYKGRKRPQAALVALDATTGQVLALVGGRSYGESQLNRATDARRQPGSVFKPFVYAAALESGLSPVSLYADAPRAFQYDVRAVYRPSNYGGGYSMRDVTMREGLVRSLNVVTVDVALRAGLSRVADTAERFGLPRPEAYPALALGTTEATPLQIASAYAAFANGGTLLRPTVIARAAGSSNASFIQHTPAPEQVINPSTAHMLTDMLAAVVDHGTARAARGALKGTALAGKTGTSRDGWFAGYTPNLVCVVWVGFDDGEQLGLTGAESALPAWVEFMKGAVELRPELGGASFIRPAGVATVEIDPVSGQLASPDCPQRERIATTHALAPSVECMLHGHLYAPPGEEAFDNTGESIAHTYSGNQPATINISRTVAAASTSTPRAIPRSIESAPSLAPATQVVVNNGRPKLTNTLRVVEGDARNR